MSVFLRVFLCWRGQKTTRARMQKMKHVSYAHVYNTVYSIANQQKVNPWIQRRLRPSSYHITSTWTRHVHQILKTQRLATNFDTVTRMAIRRQMRICELARIFCARKIQAVALRRVWRPGGPFFWQHAPCDMLTPTQGAS
jgi:hypothetical protein